MADEVGPSLVVVTNLLPQRVVMSYIRAPEAELVTVDNAGLYCSFHNLEQVDMFKIRHIYSEPVLLLRV